MLQAEHRQGGALRRKRSSYDRPRLVKDRYGAYTICNIYYDTPDYRLIRASLEKPVYKEKLRVRSYGVPREDDPVFVELKKKFDGVVYKRRITTTLPEAGPLLAGEDAGAAFGQIGREIGYFQSFYHTAPRVFIGYDRLAFAGAEDPRVRITFDGNLRWRDTDGELGTQNGVKHSDRPPLENFRRRHGAEGTGCSRRPASLVLGLGTALVAQYRVSSTQSFAVTLALLPAIVQVVIMLVNGNLGAGVAVAGAFSLVRFRSAPREGDAVLQLVEGAHAAGLDPDKLVGLGVPGQQVVKEPVIVKIFGDGDLQHPLGGGRAAEAQGGEPPYRQGGDGKEQRRQHHRGEPCRRNFSTPCAAATATWASPAAARSPRRHFKLHFPQNLLYCTYKNPQTGR